MPNLVDRENFVKVIAIACPQVQGIEDWESSWHANGIDSLDLFAILAAVEDYYSLDFTDNDIMRSVTPKIFLDLITERLK